jgi:hypothetical protein
MVGFAARDALPAFLGFWTSASGAMKSANPFTLLCCRATL